MHLEFWISASSRQFSRFFPSTFETHHPVLTSLTKCLVKFKLPLTHVNAWQEMTCNSFSEFQQSIVKMKIICLIRLIHFWMDWTILKLNGNLASNWPYLHATSNDLNWPYSWHEFHVTWNNFWGISVEAGAEI